MSNEQFNGKSEQFNAGQAFVDGKPCEGPAPQPGDGQYAGQGSPDRQNPGLTNPGPQYPSGQAYNNVVGWQDHNGNTQYLNPEQQQSAGQAWNAPGWQDFTSINPQADAGHFQNSGQADPGGAAWQNFNGNAAPSVTGQYQNSGQAYGNAAWQPNPGFQQAQQPNAQWGQPQNVIYQGVPPVFCQNCGNQIDPRATLCMNCGCQLRPIIPRGKSRIAAGVLGILLGGLGVHKFYMGRIGIGILYLIFCWTWIPSVIGLIEGIIYLCESDEKFAQRLM